MKRGIFSIVHIRPLQVRDITKKIVLIHKIDDFIFKKSKIRNRN